MEHKKRRSVVQVDCPCECLFYGAIPGWQGLIMQLNTQIWETKSQIEGATGTAIFCGQLTGNFAEGTFRCRRQEVHNKLTDRLVNEGVCKPSFIGLSCNRGCVSWFFGCFSENRDFWAWLKNEWQKIT